MSIFGRAFAGAAGLALAGCAMQPAGPPAVSPGLAPAMPPGQARLWFYRDYQPSVSFNMANINVNGARMASVPATGPGVYRDVPPGRYRIMPDDFVSAPNQGTIVTPGPGETVYLQIEDDPLVWGDMTVYQKDVFTVRPVPATKALAQIAASPQ
ncbi:MAG TPA: hypothetical protein VGG57_11870 [Stellaceae bacterium]|jgi:hypothetical protein